MAADRSIQDLYQQHHRWLNGWLGHKLGCPDSAADLAQDTFVRILRHPLDIEQLREPRAYLLTIAKRLLINHFRHQSLERAYLDTLANLPEALHPTPEDLLLLKRALEALDALLAGLPDKVRTAFLLIQLEGLSQREVAQRMGLTIRTVQRYIAQAYTHCIAADL